MLRYVLTTIPLCSLLAWMQTSETLLLTLDHRARNSSLALALSFAAGSAFCVIASERRPLMLQPKVFVGASLAASALGFASLALPFDGAHIACSCAQTALMALLVVPTGRALSPLPRRVVVPLVGVAGAGAVAIAFALSFVSPLAPALSCVFPLGVGVCLIAGGKLPQPEGDEEACEDKGQAGEGHAGSFVAVLCLCACAASLFEGTAMAPYLMNSETAWIVLTTITAAGSLLFAALGGAAVRPPRQHAPNDADDHATGRTSFLHRPLLADPATLLWVFTSFSLVLLVMGLLLFATRATGTMTSALGSVVGAKNCLVMVFWMAAPSFAASKGSFVHRFSLLSLASGMFFSTYLGAAVNRHFVISFGTLTSLATALISLVALLVILSMALRLRQTPAIENDQPYPPAPDASTPSTLSAPSLSFEDVRTAIQAHREQMLAPYGLTEREREIVLMILDGQTMGGIAEELFITERTVKFHSKNAYDKIGVHNKKELMQLFANR